MTLASSNRAEDAWRRRLTVPHYQVGEAARYAQIATATIVSWQQIGAKQTVSAREFGIELSYLQLIEVAVVAAMRKGGILLNEIRATRAFMQYHFKSEHPFAEYRFKHDGKSLWLSDRDIPGLKGRHGHLIRTGRQGQLAWSAIIGRLNEFEYERRGIVIKWHVAGDHSAVIIDPRVSYGSPNVRGIPTWVIKGRWDAGEEIREIADDFRLKDGEVSDALKFEGIDTTAHRPHKWLN
jgi:uncharacterized protein (DUF433 family)